MANLNRISVTITAEQANTIDQEIKSVLDKISALIVRLSREEAKNLSRANSRRLAPIRDILSILEANPELQVAQAPVQEMQKDYTARNYFLRWEKELEKGVEMLNDGIALASHELWQATLIHYNNGKKAEHGGVPGAAQLMDQLRPLFNRAARAEEEEVPAATAN